jgi:hypothetical protein
MVWLFSLDRLELALKWETQMMLISPLVLILYMFSTYAGLGIIALIAVILFITDSMFSVIATAIFLFPIFKALNNPNVEFLKRGVSAFFFPKSVGSSFCHCVVYVQKNPKH